MDKDKVHKQGQVPGENPTDAGFTHHLQTSRLTKAVTFDNYSFALTIIKPVLLLREIEALPVFLFVPHEPYDSACIRAHEQIVSDLVTSSAHAAAFLDCSADHAACLPLFELFAAMKWLACHGSEEGINGHKLALVGLHFGASVASILTQMAASNHGPKVGLQILIDPQFHLPRKNTSRRPVTSTTRPDTMDREWLDMNRIYNLPLESKVAELTGIPPTLIQLSENNGHHCELEYYCTKLLQAGTNVTYVNYEASNDHLQESSVWPLNQTMLAETAAELKNWVE
jgi:acetyl esterase